MSQAPFEIVAGPVQLYFAPVGENYPDIADTPAGQWVLVGTSGNLNYDESGVSVKHKDKVDFFMPLGSTGPIKAFRTSEEQTISLKLADVSLENYNIALNFNTVGTIVEAPGVSGAKKLGLIRGPEVQQRALLIRGEGLSAYGSSWNKQYEIPVAVQTGDPQADFTKGKPVVLSLEFTTLVDPDATSDDERFGRLIDATSDQGT